MSSELRIKAAKGLRAGDTFVLTRRFRQDHTNSFGDITRDYNPVHYDTQWTETKGFNGLICHGLLVGSMICEFGGQVGWLATGMDFNFIKPVYFNDTIECRIVLTQVEESGRAAAQAKFFNQNGVQVARAGLTGRLPVDREKDLLHQMVKQGDPTNKLAKQ